MAYSDANVQNGCFGMPSYERFIGTRFLSSLPCSRIEKTNLEKWCCVWLSPLGLFGSQRLFFFVIWERVATIHLLSRWSQYTRLSCHSTPAKDTAVTNRSYWTAWGHGVTELCVAWSYRVMCVALTTIFDWLDQNAYKCVHLSIHSDRHASDIIDWLQSDRCSAILRITKDNKR